MRLRPNGVSRGAMARPVGVVLLLVLLAISAAASSTVTASAAGPTSTPPPTPAPVTGSPSPFPTVLHTPGRPSAPPRLATGRAVLEDLETGQVLLARAAERRHPIASLTKIMTAQLAIRATAPGDMVTVGPEAASVGGSSLGLQPGERIQVRQLLFALLLQSSNDAAVALAQGVSRTVPAFVQLMNRRAAALGLHDTRFYSPNGLDDRGYSSPADLAALTRHAFGLPLFAEVVRTKFHDIPAPSGGVRRVQNRNVLLWLYPGAVGVKTGFTTPAGHCLVAVARRGARSLVAVVLGAPSEQAMFDDAAALLNYGFAGFARRRLVTGGETVGTVILSGRAVPVAAVRDFIRLVPKGGPARVSRSLQTLQGVQLPVHTGDRVATEVVTVDGNRLGAVLAVAERDVARAPPPAPPSTPGSPLVIRLLLAALRVLLSPFL